MAAVAKDVALSFGLMSATVALHNALEDSKSGNKQVCVGGFSDLLGNEHPSHAPTPIKQARMCGDVIVPYAEVKKARPVADGFVLITDEEIAEASADVTAMKKRAALTPHPSEQVATSTVPGEKLYYLTPAAGSEQAYAAMTHLVSTHPDLTFVCQWAARSRASQYALQVREGVLCMQERVRQENLRAVPEVHAEAPEPMLAMADQVLGLPGIVTDYDPATYADTYEQKLNAIIASKSPVAGQTEIPVAGVNVPSSATPGMAALEAMLAAAGGSAPAPKKRAARKTTAKKAS